MDAAPISSPTSSPVAQWRAAAPELIALTDPAAVVAEAILLHLHYAIDWDDSTWLAAQRHRYWDEILPRKVRSAAYRSATLEQLWSMLRESNLPMVPVRAERRLELANLLRYEPAAAVLTCLQTNRAALLMRVQIVASAVSDANDVKRAARGSRGRLASAEASGASARRAGARG